MEKFVQEFIYTIDSIYLRTRDMKRQYFTIDSDKHSAPRLSTPSKGVNNCNTEIVSVNKAGTRLREFAGYLVAELC